MARATRSEIIRSEIAHKEHTKVKARSKDQQKFQEELKRSAQKFQNPSLIRQTSQAATEQAVRYVKQEDDRGRDKKGREKSEDREGRKSGEGDRKTDGKEAQQRVVAKHGVKDEGGGQGKGGRGGGFTGRRSTTTTRSKLQSGRQGPAQLRSQFARKLSKAMGKPTRALTQHVLNQIVKSVRILVNSDEEKEIRLELHEKIFKGLKLRVATKGKGKVAVHFTAANSEVRELFTNNEDKIRRALKRKGIDVDEIVVT